MESPTVPIVSNGSSHLPPYSIVMTEAELENLSPLPGQLVAVDLETSSLEPQTGFIVGFSCRSVQGRFYCPLRHSTGNAAISPAAMVKFIERLSQCRFINQNTKFELKWFRYVYGILFRPHSDTMVLGHLFNSNTKLSLKGDDGLVVRYLGSERNREEFNDIVPKGLSIDSIEVSVVAKYAVADVDDVWDLFHFFETKRPSVGSFIHELEITLIYELVDIELHGVRIDKVIWDKMTVEQAQEVALLKDGLTKHFGVEVNPDSPAQVKKAFLTMGVELSRGTIDGDYSVSQKFLKHAAKGNDSVREYLEYKKAQKIYGSFLAGFTKFVRQVAEDWVVYPNYMTVHVSTGRMSSSSPNLQNIPKSGRIRSMFVPRAGHYFIEADYSQVELRVMASESRAKVWLEAFERKEDLHRKMGSVMLGKPAKDISDEERRYCKTLNFGVIYGMNEWGLGQQLDKPVEECKELINLFFGAVPEVEEFIEAKKQEAVDKGWVCTKFGRVRYIPEVYSVDRKERGFGFRTAVNTVIQGSAADLNKIGFVRLCKKLKPRGIWPLINVHDSVLFEVPDSVSVKDAEVLIRSCMIFPIEGYCELDIDLKAGPNWEDLDKPVALVKPEPTAAANSIAKGVQECNRCECRKDCQRPVSPIGTFPAKVMIVTKSPSDQEESCGAPLPEVAPAGAELELWLTELGLKRSEVWITNTVKCKMKWDRRPSADEVKTCKGWLDAELDLVSPKLVICLGNEAVSAFTGDGNISATASSGMVVKTEAKYKVLLLHHPVSVLRNKGLRGRMTDDLAAVKRIIQEVSSV